MFDALEPIADYPINQTDELLPSNAKAAIAGAGSAGYLIGYAAPTGH